MVAIEVHGEVAQSLREMADKFYDILLERDELSRRFNLVVERSQIIQAENVELKRRLAELELQCDNTHSIRSV